MRTTSIFSVLAFGCALTALSCGQTNLPSSPSALIAGVPGSTGGRLQARGDAPGVPGVTGSDPTAPGAPVGAPTAPCTVAAPPGTPAGPGAAAPVAPARVIARDDPAAPPLAPPPAAAPADPCAPSALADIINIVSYFGSGAFMPNPIMANVGDNIVFTNTDSHVHHIVLDDGTDLGEVQPGASTAPMALATPTASFHCTIHPTMVGTINMDLPAMPYDPPPTDYYGYY